MSACWLGCHAVWLSACGLATAFGWQARLSQRFICHIWEQRSLCLDSCRVEVLRRRLNLSVHGRRWVTPGALIFAENVQNVSFSPANTVINDAGCTYGDYDRPISLGVNAVDIEIDY
jgi:hypothetical protein